MKTCFKYFTNNYIKSSTSDFYSDFKEMLDNLNFACLLKRDSKSDNFVQCLYEMTFKGISQAICNN